MTYDNSVRRLKRRFIPLAGVDQAPQLSSRISLNDYEFLSHGYASKIHMEKMVALVTSCTSWKFLVADVAVILVHVSMRCLTISCNLKLIAIPCTCAIVAQFEFTVDIEMQIKMIRENLISVSVIPHIVSNIILHEFV